MNNIINIVDFATHYTVDVVKEQVDFANKVNFDKLSYMRLRHLVSITDLSAKEIVKIINLGIRLKGQLKKKVGNKKVLSGKTLAMIFEKPSLRTRLSFEVGMTQLGGHAIYLGPNDIQMGTREPLSDIAKVTSSMVDVIMARTFSHQTIQNEVTPDKTRLHPRLHPRCGMH